MTPPIALTMGDPAGVGPQIALSAWEALRETGPAFFLIAPEGVVETAKAHVSSPTPFTRIESPEEAISVFPDALPLYCIDGPSVPPGTPDVSAATSIISAISTAVRLTEAGQASAVVTNPIAKSLLYKSGFSFPGHTEYLAHLTASDPAHPPAPVMMLTGGGLRVALATIHMALRDVPGALDWDSLSHTARTVHSALRTDFAIAAPKIAFAGLNPHAGENGSMGQEEVLIINPTAEALRVEGIDISDARPGDTVFTEMLDGRYDAVIAMYHDQGLAPLKTLDLWNGVNTTLGLPIVRTSPDHGTAYDAAVAGTAKPDSLIAALRSAARISENRRSFVAA